MNLLNSEYNDQYMIQMRNPYFDSEKDQLKLINYYENRYRSLFIKGLIFLVYIASLIIILFFNLRAPWHYEYRTSVDKVLAPDRDSQPLVRIDIESEDIFQFYKLSHLFKLDNLNSIRTYMYDIFPFYFTLSSDSFFFMKTGSLIKNTLILTSRRMNRVNNTDPILGTREYETLCTNEIMSNMNTTSYYSGELIY